MFMIDEIHASFVLASLWTTNQNEIFLQERPSTVDQLLEWYNKCIDVTIRWKQQSVVLSNYIKNNII